MTALSPDWVSDDGLIQLYCGDSADILPQLPTHSVASVITDPPAGISFMGKEWDGSKGGRDKWIDWLAGILKESLRICKPGGTLACWSLPRTSHWTGISVESAGWDIFDVFQYVFGTGFPKSLDISKAIDKAAGAEREVVGSNPHARPNSDDRGEGVYGGGNGSDHSTDITAPATAPAKLWDGYGTALKPAAEFWWLAYAPREGSYAENAQKHGVAGLNVDGCRVPISSCDVETIANMGGYGKAGWQREPTGIYNANVAEHLMPTRDAKPHTSGRWPANLSHDGSEEVVGMFPDSKCVGTYKNEQGPGAKFFGGQSDKRRLQQWNRHDNGSAARFFQECPRFMYGSKPSRSERNENLEDKPDCEKPGRLQMRQDGGLDGHITAPAPNNHPTVKSLSLMRYLCKLTKPPEGGIVLDPFMGSGTTVIAAWFEHRAAIGIEADDEYFRLAQARVEGAIRREAKDMPLFS